MTKRSLLSGGQVLQYVFDPATTSLRVEPAAGGGSPTGLVDVPFNEIGLSYIIAGNGTGQIGTVTYKQSGTTVATLTLTYDTSNRLIDVLRS